jgi:hypothetical protein
MKILLTIQNFLVNLVNTFLTIGKVMLQSNLLLKPAPELTDHRAIILGNGPSLLKSIESNRGILSNYQLICVNHFAEHALYRELKPGLYVMAAPENWLDDVEPFYREKGEKLFKAIAEHTRWNIQFYIPYSARKFKWWRELITGNKYIHIKYFNVTPVEGFKFFRYFCYNHLLGMPRPHNVLIPSIMIALSAGFGNIYLFGADHSWLQNIWVDDENNVMLKQKHFYDQDKVIARPMDYLGKGKRKMHEVLIKFYHAFKGYFEIDAYSRSQGKTIYNCTPDSYIDAFERVKTPLI